MAKILITRHGQTKRNVEGIVQGPDHGDINEEGFKQIAKLIKRLEKENISKIISSDIPRCVITSKEILKKIKVPIVYTSLIREKDNGELIGRHHKEINWNDFGSDFETRKAPNGENLLEVKERSRKFFKELLEEFKDSKETILVVSHGAFLKILIGDLLGMSLSDSIFKLFIEHCSITEIELSSKYSSGYQIKTLNEKNHLF